ncbi:MAG: TSUP family transporter [Eubacteriales bacterium]|nr:TSUP family transporter [Eubacteriales bacterium]
MTPTIYTYLLVCPFLFLAGLVDSIAGGGGLISLPIYLIAGLPPHLAVGTNKMSSTFGTALTTVRFIKEKLVSAKLAVPSVIAAIIGSSLGAQVSMRVDEKIMKYVLLVVLPVAAFVVLNKNLFSDEGKEEAVVNRKTIIVAAVAALVVGFYDGFYGPGTGTFLIIAFTVFAHMKVGVANAQAKVINVTTNMTALITFLISGKVLIGLGVAAALCNIAGNYVGSGLAIKKGAAIVRPVIIGVLILLALRVLGVY